jgi:LytS/YehU family sensor histidine kinase
VQHLVENAVRHGIARRSGSGRLVISASRERDHLVVRVEDDGAGVGDAPAPPGHGLEHTRERLRVLYGDEASLSLERAGPFGAIATLRLPYRELPGTPDG